MDKAMGVERSSSLEVRTTLLTGVVALVRVYGVVGLQVTLVHECMSADVAHEARPLLSVTPPVSPHEGLSLVHFLTYVTFPLLGIDM